MQLDLPPTHGRVSPYELKPLFLASWLAAVSACGSAESVFVALPSFASESKTLIIAEEAETGFELEAFSLDDWSFRAELSAELRSVRLLLYTQTLGELGLTDGPLSRAMSEACGARQLATPHESFVLDPTGAAPRFDGAAGLPSGLGEFEYAGHCDCVDPEVRMVDVGNLGHGRQIERHADGYRLLTSSGLYGLSSSLEVKTSTLIPSLYAMYSDPGGTSWVGGDRGRLYRWSSGGLVELWLEIPGAGEIEQVGPGPNAGELLLAATSGLFRIRDRSAELLRPAMDTPNVNALAVLARLPTGASLVGLYRTPNLLLVRPGSASIEVIPWSSGLEPPQRLDFIEGVGLLLGTRVDRVFVSTDEGASWTDRSPSEVERTLLGIREFIPFRGGNLEAGSGGIRQWSASARYCPTLRWADAPQLRSLVLSPDGDIVVVGEPPRDDPRVPTPIYVLETGMLSP